MRYLLQQFLYTDLVVSLSNGFDQVADTPRDIVVLSFCPVRSWNIIEYFAWIVWHRIVIGVNIVVHWIHIIILIRPLYGNISSEEGSNVHGRALTLHTISICIRYIRPL